MIAIFFFLCFSFVLSDSGLTYYVKTNGGKTKCEPNNRCSFSHAVNLIGWNEDGYPTIDLSVGEYKIDPHKDFYATKAKKAITFISTSGGVVIKNNPASRITNNGTTSYLFEISGKSPTIKLQNIGFQVTKLDGIFEVANCETLTVEMKDVVFENCDLKKAVFVKVQKLVSLTMNSVNVTSCSSPIISSGYDEISKTEDSDSSSIPFTLHNCFFTNNEKVIEFDSSSKLKLDMDECEITGSKDTSIEMGSEDMEISITNSHIHSNTDSVFEFSKTPSSIVISGNRFEGNTESNSNSDNTFIFDFSLDSSNTVYDISLTNNWWFKNSVGLVNIEIHGDSSKNPSNTETNVVALKNERFLSNHIASEGLFIVSDFRTDTSYTMTFDTLTVLKNSVLKSDNGIGTIILTIAGDLTANVLGGEYSLNNANYGGSFYFSDPDPGNSRNGNPGPAQISFYKTVFTNNSVNGYGGGVCAIRSSSSLSLSFDGCEFKFNDAWAGGALFFSAKKAIVAPKLNISKTSITHNVADGFGGAVLINDDLTSINSFLFIDPQWKYSQSNQIHSNHARDGGGVYFANRFLLKYDKTVVHNNSASEGSNVLTSPVLLKSKNPATTTTKKNGGNKNLNILISCEEKSKKVTCKTGDDLLFLDGYDQILKDDCFSPYQVKLRFDGNEGDYSSTKIASGPMVIEVKDVKKDYYEKQDGELTMNGVVYDVVLTFPKEKENWFDKHKTPFIIAGGVVVMIGIIICCVIGICFVCVILTVACWNAPVFDRVSDSTRRKYQVIQN